jgi:hypothetical protein
MELEVFRKKLYFLYVFMLMSYELCTNYNSFQKVTFQVLQVNKGRLTSIEAFSFQLRIHKNLTTELIKIATIYL